MSDMSHTPQVLFSVTNCICYDQRVLKMAETVSGMGCDVLLIGRKGAGCCETDTVTFRSKRFKMLFRKGFLFYMFFNIRLFAFLLLHKADILVANDLDTLLPNFLVSRLKGLPLVYDSHEYFTGVPEIQNRPFVKWVWKSIEKQIFPHLKYVMTVSDSIASLYEAGYGKRPVVVRNCSSQVKEAIPFTREEFDIAPGHLLVILQGTGINADRGGEELVEAMRLTDNVFLLIVGSGDVIEILKSMVLEFDLSDRVRFIPRVPAKTLMKFTSMADAGLTLDKDTNINYRFSLPNKVFDYISAGIPVIASNLPEVSRIVTGYNCGIIVDSVNPESIASAFSELQSNQHKRIELKENAVLASGELNWSAESLKVRSLYREVFSQKVESP